MALGEQQGRCGVTSAKKVWEYGSGCLWPALCPLFRLLSYEVDCLCVFVQGEQRESF